MAANLAIAAQLPRVGRKLRQPKHTWSVKHLPFAIQPICIAPVLPGETLKNALIQARAVTQPIRHPLIGWWLEYYWFYIRHRALADGETLQNMMLDPSVTAPNQAVASVPLYSQSGRPRYIAQCLDAVVEAYFRDRGQAANAVPDIGGVRAARIQDESWMNSANTVTLNNAGDFNVDSNADSTIQASEVANAYERWQFMRLNNLTDATYEDYLRSYGIRIESDSNEYPELIRYTREWQYPSNTIDPLTGQPSSAVSWSVAERADKDRFFREPGFVFGVTLARPKVYLAGQAASAIQLLNDAFSWLPAILRDDPMTSVKTVPAGMVPSAAAGQAIDTRDLFLYGDQFLNYTIASAGDGSSVALPAGTNWRYPTEAMAKLFFLSETPTGVEQDGIVRLSILGAQVDHTPRGSIAGQSA